jgi:hypothetical protein
MDTNGCQYGLSWLAGVMPTGRLTQGVVTMSVGRLPTLIGLPGVLVAVLIGVTVSENMLVT